ncbi:MAG: DMT family transporter [Spirochaetales bacterium]|uniref:DMT family transporter n=1 Tax=Candidatus Thalassospirochaeta sargassi TaxID=3119039 RepID=A0AAJ1IC63_9SPIO|nr:DMT family transporter [Spirochaetales bacterium]
MKKSTAVMFCIGSMVCWSIGPILIRYVKDYFSVSFQNFFRFAVSIVILWLFSLITAGKGEIRKTVSSTDRILPKLLLIAVCNFSHQFFLIKGVYLILPGLVTIIEESTILFAAALSFVFIPDERQLVRQPVFITGLVLAFFGVVMTSCPEVNSFLSMGVRTSVHGIWYILISSFSWALFSLLIRLWLPSLPAAVTSSLVFSLVIPFFILSMFLEGGATAVAAGTPAFAWGILAVSGIIGIGLGYSFYYQALRVLGVTLTSSLGLLIPLATMLLSFLVFGERLAPVQIIGAAALLCGCFLIVRKSVT